MSERRAPYKLTHPAAAQLAAQGIGNHQAAELEAAKRRIAQLEEAAREVCRTESKHFEFGINVHKEAIRALGNLINYPGWWQL